MKQLETLCLGRHGSEDDDDRYDDGIADDYGDHDLSDQDVLTMGRALKGWPLPLLKRASGNPRAKGGGEDFEICQQELGLPPPRDPDIGSSSLHFT